jgi:DnaJ family protein C protein 13
MLWNIYACWVVDVPIPGVEIQCIGHFRLLFGFLSVESCKPIQRGALNVISSVTQNQECVNDIAASDVLVHLLLILCSLPDTQITALETLYALMHTTRIVKDALAKGEHVCHAYPKDIFVFFHGPVL